MYLIVGLGNPGAQYEHTRHNVGFDVLTILSEKLHIPINRTRSNALVGEGQFQGEKIALCKPQTYMNLSGEAVQQLMHWYKLPPERLLVISTWRRVGFASVGMAAPAPIMGCGALSAVSAPRRSHASALASGAVPRCLSLRIGCYHVTTPRRSARSPLTLTMPQQTPRSNGCATVCKAP